jgi:DNA-binding transcriptional LysR family regulator
MIDSLTLDQMRVLVAVADAGSFSAASRKLGRVQSAISQSIQTLEATLSLSLFDRSGKTPRLTDAGRALVGDARALIAGAQAIRARAQSMAEDVEPELTLAVDSMLPIPLLMESLKALRIAFPLLPASVFTEALGGAEQRLRDGAARLAIYTLTPASPCDLVSEFMTRVAIWPVVAAARRPAPAASP